MSAHSPAQLHDMLQESASQADLARMAAGMTKGATHRRYMAYAAQHHRNAIAISDALYGPVPADILAMSDEELIATLTA